MRAVFRPFRAVCPLSKTRKMSYAYSMKMKKAMSVFVVVGGNSYEGESWDLGGKVFMNRKDAESYAESLRVSFDYVLVREVDVV